MVEDADDFDEAVVVGLVDPEAADAARASGVVEVWGCMSLSCGGRLVAGRPGTGVPPSRRGLRGRLDGLGLLVVAGLAVEELDACGDDLELLAAAAVLGLPFGVLQAAFDRDAAALGEVLAADLRLGAEDGDVDEVGAAVLAVLAARALDCEAQPADLGARAVVELGVGGETCR